MLRKVLTNPGNSRFVVRLCSCSAGASVERDSGATCDTGPKVSGSKSVSRKAENRKALEIDLKDTQNRIRRWRTRNHAMLLQDEDVGNISTLSEGEFQSRVDLEESEWSDRANELYQILAHLSVNDSKELPTVSGTKHNLTAEDIELKKKTGKVKFREIVYSEGELDESDLTIPPSPENPHPFDPSLIAPPIYSRSIAPFVNHVPLLQTLVDLGVDLFEIDCSTKLGRHLLRLNTDKDVKPKLQWLISVGIRPKELGKYLTRNPFFLIQNLDDMKARVNYLESKKFTTEQIVKIINGFRYWLNVDVKTMDARLGWIQKQFSLSGNDVRHLIIKEPRIVMFGLGPIQRLVNLFNKEFEFTEVQVKKMLIDDPRLFIMDSKYISSNYHYCHRVMELTNETISSNPFILRCSLSNLKNRHEFLRKLDRAYYVGQIRKSEAVPTTTCESVDLIPIENLLCQSDADFARLAAKTYLVAYNRFLKSH